MKPTAALLVILILAALIRAAGWSTDDVKSPAMIFQPDEYQHLEIAKRQVFRLNTKLYPREEVPTNAYNVYGFGNQVGFWAWVGTFITKKAPDNDDLIMTGRVCATVFSLLLIGIVFLLGWRIFDSTTAIFGASLLAINDLSITYAHYFLPSSAYVCWLYLFVYAAWRYYQKPDFKHILFLALPIAGAFSYKFDFIPLMLGGLVLLWPKIDHAYTLVKRSGILFLGLVVIFHLLVFFNFTPDNIMHSFTELTKQNKNAILEDNHLLHNPILYLLGSIAAVGLPVFLAFLGGTTKMIQKVKQWPPATVFFLIILTLLLGMEFGVRWLIDTPFIRRLNFFMPAIALLAGYQLAYWWKQTSRFTKPLVIAIMAYSIAFVLVSQSNHWADTRYAAQEYLTEHHQQDSIFYSTYSRANGAIPGATRLTNSKIYVTHETFYRRFTKSFTTPFKLPKCCEEVYHCCCGDQFCYDHQKFIADTHPEFQLIKAFETVEFFPERIGYHALFGHFETFRGDELIFERTEPPINE